MPYIGYLPSVGGGGDCVHNNISRFPFTYTITLPEDQPAVTGGFGSIDPDGLAYAINGSLSFQNCEGGIQSLPFALNTWNTEYIFNGDVWPPGFTYEAEEEDINTAEIGTFTFEMSRLGDVITVVIDLDNPIFSIRTDINLPLARWTFHTVSNEASSPWTQLDFAAMNFPNGPFIDDIELNDPLENGPPAIVEAATYGWSFTPTRLTTQRRFNPYVI